MGWLSGVAPGEQVVEFRDLVIGDAALLSRSAEAITGARGTGWFGWMLWQEQHPEFPAHESYASLKLGIFAQLDPNFLRFLTPESVNPADLNHYRLKPVGLQKGRLEVAFFKLCMLRMRFEHA